MNQSSGLSFVMAAMFMLNVGVATAEEPADTQQAKSDATQAEKPTHTKKEEAANPNPTEGDTAKPKEEPNCE